MSGLDKINSHILEEANQTAAAKLAEAREKAERIVAEAGEKAQAEAERSRQISERDIKNYMDRVASSCDMQKKRAILAAKQEMISEVLNQAYARVIGLPDDAYFSMIKKLLEAYVQPEKGVICFSETDLKRIPQGFEAEIAEIAQSKGGSLSISDKGKVMDGGCILVYGGIEENCTIRAIFDARRDELSDMVQEMLFG
ncbi:V-type ATP synthase subunit E [Frisingicoccus sp.]|uniref:V-type ATP synthase subunit E n=1 Tax=Frisingicoccus sp. TaxID=1918627 RepID=UPI002E784416|nr:V-type ATP synthase subunit E family protein [Frisingicoccus sp.]MEE0752289.1 V-type ATP synthase subunit E family protein [Frisingicoccus sp.]